MNRKIVVLTTASAALLLAACGTVAALDNGAPSPTPAPSGSATEHVHDDTHAHDFAFVESPEKDVVFYGQTVTYGDGLSVTATAPAQTVIPEQYDAGYPHPYQVTVRITNNSDKKYDPSYAVVSLQSGSTEAQQILISSAGSAGMPKTLVLPGRSVEFQVAFDVDNPTNTVLQVSPNWERNPVYFENAPTSTASPSATPSTSATPKPSASPHKD